MIIYLVNNNARINTRVEEVKKEALASGTVQTLALSGVDANKYATVSEVQNIMMGMYPVGSIYISTSNANPSGSIDGTWEAYAGGRTLVGVGTSDQAFTVGNTGGNSNSTLSIANIPSHNHSIPSLSGTTNIAGDHNHTIKYSFAHVANLAAGDFYAVPALGTDSNIILNNGNHSHTVTTNANTSGSTGSGQAFNNLQPYITVYMWRRIS